MLFAVAMDKRELERRLDALRSPHFSDDDLRRKFALQDNRDWKLAAARKRLMEAGDWREPIYPLPVPSV